MPLRMLAIRQLAMPTGLTGITESVPRTLKLNSLMVSMSLFQKVSYMPCGQDLMNEDNKS